MACLSDMVVLDREGGLDPLLNAALLARVCCTAR